MNAQGNQGWADRLGPTARYTLIAVTGILGMLMIGMVAGFSYAIYEEGELPTRPLAYIIFAAMLGLSAIVGWVLALLVRSLRSQPMSGFDRRYWKMWAGVVALGMPIGLVLAILGLSDQGDGLSFVISNAPIAPLTAILVSVVLTILLVLAAVYYHRTVDDHEERAYLWGSTIAYYFLVLVFPLHWLLARGGLVPQLSIGIVMLLILVSCVLQALAWAVLKFR